MFFLLQWIGSGLKWLLGAIVTPLAGLRKQRGFWRYVRYAVHAVAVLLALTGLAWINYYFELDCVLRTPLPLLRYVWLPVMFALGYSLLWLGWYVCRAMLCDDTRSEFPDLDQAWSEAMNSVRKAGIDVARTPLYLMIGKPRGSVNDLMRAARVPLVTPPTPAESSNPPLQVFANREAIYVSCPEGSLLGRQAALFATAPEIAGGPITSIAAKPAADDQAVNDDVALEEFPYEGTDGEAGGTALATAAAVKRETAVAAAGLSLVEERVAQLVAEYDSATLADFGPEMAATAQLDPITLDLTAALLREPEEIELLLRRLEHVCHLIREERHPFVPVHGVLTLLPAVASDCETASHHLGELVRRDLEAIQGVIETRCPRVAIVCDLEQSPGAESLLGRFPAEQRHRRLGTRLLEHHAGQHSAGEDAIEHSLEWLRESLLTPLTYRLMESPPPAGSERETVQGNIGLYRFLFRMRTRCQRLAVTLRRAAPAGNVPESFCGCYLVASGSDSQREQGFAEAVFAQLPQLTSTLAWSESALRHDRRQQRLAACGYAGLALITAALLLVMLTT